MKTNFKYLKKQLNKINDRLSDEGRYLRDLNFLLREVEKRIYFRELVEACYPLRMSLDLSIKFILFIIKNSQDSVFQKWNKNIKDYLSTNNIKSFNNRNPSFKTLLNSYPGYSFYIENVGDIDEFLKIVSSMHKWMHYEYDSNFKENNNAENPNDKSTLYLHRNEVRFNIPKLEEVITYLEAIWYLVVKIMNESNIFAKSESDDKNDYKFDRDIYKDAEPALIKLLNIKQVDELIHRKKCPLCDAGNFIEPNSDTLDKEIFPYGAFIECENCGAKVDKSLKTKRNFVEKNDGDSTCPECKQKDALQWRYNLIYENQKKYQACKKCSWNNRDQKTNNKEIKDVISDAIEDMTWLYE